ncbi:hypothetical protein FRC08_003281 [Ceratobasidium sp. 394]|nr:hypothetical protein FRC08_003281 [Ceratobasidium sp. 394]
MGCPDRFDADRRCWAGYGAFCLIRGAEEGNLDVKIRESEIGLFQRAEASAKGTGGNMKPMAGAGDIKESMKEMIK